MKLVTVAQMRELEQAAVDAGSSFDQLMEEAGLAVAQEAWMLLGSLEGRHIVALVGPGNNGGDALVAVRHLADWGADVAAYIPRKRRHPEREQELAEREAPIVAGEDDPDAGQLDALLSVADLVIDGLLGIGQERPIDPDEPIGVALSHLAAARSRYQPPKLVAVDLPTGINADSGAADALVVEPDLTVTFGLPKIGMYQAPASTLIGRVQVIDIGIPKAAQDAVQLELMTARWARDVLPVRPGDGNKGTFGRVLVVGGSKRFAGAPALSATAAYRAGAGLVTVACPEPIQQMLASSLSEATWLPLSATSDGNIPADAVHELRPELDRYSACVIGPGLGDREDTRALVWALLPDFEGRPLVIDADALNALASMDDAADRVPSGAVLTPHPGEMARLLGRTVADIQSRRLEVAQEAARRFHATVVLKGAHTVVADQDGRVHLSSFANPLLATAGSGDVLAGMIAGYLAQGLDSFAAASLGVYLHGMTGEALREEYGDSGLLAGEIAARLPRTVRDIRQG